MKNVVTANEELNRWCGTEGINYYEGIEALGFLFKYAVPKTAKAGYEILISCPCGTDGVTRYNVMLLKEDAHPYEYSTGIMERLEDALFWAIWEVIHGWDLLYKMVS